jgi:hypothetical protein
VYGLAIQYQQNVHGLEYCNSDYDYPERKLQYDYAMRQYVYGSFPILKRYLFQDGPQIQRKNFR